MRRRGRPLGPGRVRRSIRPGRADGPAGGDADHRRRLHIHSSARAHACTADPDDGRPDRDLRTTASDAYLDRVSRGDRGTRRAAHRRAHEAAGAHRHPGPAHGRASDGDDRADRDHRTGANPGPGDRSTGTDSAPGDYDTATYPAASYRGADGESHGCGPIANA